ncbi:MAG: 2-amino-4-oxopentanoate thiolase subunit OrtA [Caldicoprobacterales bacterium]
MEARQGEWVQIHQIILAPEERSPYLPDDTKKVPLEMWQKGFLLHDAKIGDCVEIETVIGRRAKGYLVKVKPIYDHNFGEPILELLSIGRELRSILYA